MRLTLRTLLAYMDDILDPADQEDLSRKIEASPFATELIHRTRDTVRRLRLSAPAVMAGDEGEVLSGDHVLDANTVAEYLDNTLAPEEVADFERACLEAGPNADMLLAEVASCHHVLTLVLGEPAEVDADLRKRMYALGANLGHAPAAQTPSAASAGATPAMMQPAPAEAAVVDRRPRVDPDEAAIPDYMLEAARVRRRRQRMITAAIAAAVVCGGITWLAWPQGEPALPEGVAKMGNVENLIDGVEVEDAPAADARTSSKTTTSVGEPADSGGEAPRWNSEATTESRTAALPDSEDDEASLLPGAEQDAAETSADPSMPPRPDAPLGEASTPAGPAVDASAQAAADASVAPGTGPRLIPPQLPLDGTSPVAPTPRPPAPTDLASGGPPAPGEGDAAGGGPAGPAAPGPDGAMTSATPTPPQQALPDQSGAQSGGGVPPVLTPGSGAVPPTGASPADAMAAGPPPTGAPLAGSDPPSEFSGDPGSEAAAPGPPRPVGSYLGNNDLLLRFDPAANAWTRVPPRSTLAPGELLLALPTFRTHVVLADANAYLSGGTEIELGPAAAPAGSDISVAMPYGRLILNAGLNGNRLMLAFGDQTRLVALAPSSSLAIEVRRPFQPGANPQTEPSPVEIEWFVASGSVHVGESVEGQDIEGPAAWATINGVDQPPQAIDELPEWINAAPLSDAEQRAHRAMMESLAVGQPVVLRLAELSDQTNLGRRREDRLLAARAGAYVGEFSGLVRALADVNQRSVWKTVVDELRAAIARDPASVEAIHQELSVQRGADAADNLMEMLIGYSRAAIGTSRAEVKDGALVRLVNWLNNDDLAFRVLALHNINEITGTSGLGGYRPEHTASQRQRTTRYYWDRLERGELMPRDVREASP